MWGNFMDKAKEMAANIDQQINESVGMETTTTNTSSTMTMKKDDDDPNNENAWNSCDIHGIPVERMELPWATERTRASQMTWAIQMTLLNCCGLLN